VFDVLLDKITELPPAGAEDTQAVPLLVKTLPDVLGEVSPVPPLATGSAVPDKVTASVPELVIGDPVTVKKVGTDIATEVTLPAPDPAPIAVLNEAASNALTVLSTLNLGKVIALGFVNVYTFPPTVVAPIAVLNEAASNALTVLSALNRGKVIALGFVNVYTFPPTVVAPRLVLAVAAKDAPVPPLATGTTPLIEAGVIATKSGVAKLLSHATTTVVPVATVTPVVGEVGPP